jgi:hypothetical protein
MWRIRCSMRRGSIMDEARMFRRAFAIGLLTLGVALAGQVATSQRADAGPQRPAAVRSLYAHVAPRAESCLAQRVARAVIGAVLSGLA